MASKAAPSYLTHLDWCAGNLPMFDAKRSINSQKTRAKSLTNIRGKILQNGEGHTINARTILNGAVSIDSLVQSSARKNSW